MHLTVCGMGWYTYRAVSKKDIFKMKKIIKQPEKIARGTQKYIIDTARNFFSEYSYLGVSMSDIAKKLDITKAALYYHFAIKAEIYEKVLDQVFYELRLTVAVALGEDTAAKKLHKLIKSYLEFGFREKNLIKAMALKLSPVDEQIIKHVSKLRQQISNMIQPVITEVLEGKRPKNRVDGRLLSAMLTSMMDGLLLEYSFLNKPINSTKVSDQIINVLF